MHHVMVSCDQSRPRCGSILQTDWPDPGLGFSAKISYHSTWLDWTHIRTQTRFLHWLQVYFINIHIHRINRWGLFLGNHFSARLRMKESKKKKTAPRYDMSFCQWMDEIWNGACFAIFHNHKQHYSQHELLPRSVLTCRQMEVNGIIIPDQPSRGSGRERDSRHCTIAGSDYLTRWGW